MDGWLSQHQLGFLCLFVSSPTCLIGTGLDAAAAATAAAAGGAV